MKKEGTCCIVGHFPTNLPFGIKENDERCIRLKELLKQEISTMIRDRNVKHFLCPMNPGAELFAAEIIEGLQSSGENITLTAVLPYELQAEDWSEDSRNRFFECVRKCNKEKLLQTHYDDTCIAKNIQFMIDASDCVIAVWNGSLGNVSFTVQLANEKGIPVTVIDPTLI